MKKNVNLILRDIEIDDLNDYLYWNHPGREFHKFNAPYYKKDNEKELTEKIKILKTKILNGEKNVLKFKKIIADKNNNKIIGEVNRYRKSKETLRMEVGIVIFNEKYWGKGIGYNALFMRIEELFSNNPKLVRLGLSTRSGNERMVNLAKKLGFKREAVYKRARIVENKYYDSISYGILREEREYLNNKNEYKNI